MTVAEIANPIRTRMDCDAEVLALAARNQGTIVAGYARALLDRPGAISLTGQEVNALLFGIAEWEDRCERAAEAWIDPPP